MDHDIIVSGGGIAGLTASAAFASAGFDVLCVDPAPPITARDAQGADQRSTAFLQPARQLLMDVGLWERLAPYAAPLQIMRIIDAGGPEPEARMSKEFDASDISELPFGWNLPNWLLRREMAAHLESLPNVTYRTGVGAKSLFTRTSEARVGLSDGTRVRARLVIAADGRGSPMRDAAGIDVKTTRYGQKALAFSVTHELPHENVSTEIHRTGGPFTLVDKDGTTVTDADVITEPTLIYFGYTFCPDVCPIDMDRNARAVDILADQGISARPMFISVDPERDTPEYVGEYAAAFHERAIGLTGSVEQVAAASRAYKTFYQKQGDDPEYYLVQHTTFSYLTLPEHGFVEFYRQEASAEEVAESVACYSAAS